MTHLHALLTGEPPDLEWWRQLDMPDVRTYELRTTGAGRQTQAMRTQVLGDISRRVGDAVTAIDGRTALVAVDGVDGAGKTHLADELAQALCSAGTQVIRASVDGFHHPPEVRYRRGRGSPEGFYRDSYDLEALRRLLLEPVRRGTGEPVVTEIHDVDAEQALSPTPVVPPRHGVLLLDGIFLHRPELIDLWDLTIWVDVPFSLSVPRGAARDGTDPDPSAPSQRRYVEGQRLYLADLVASTAGAASGGRCATIACDGSTPSRPDGRARRTPPRRPR